MRLQGMTQPTPAVEPPFTITDGINLFWSTVRHFGTSIIERLPYLLVGIVVFLLFYGIAGAARRVLRNLLERTHTIDPMLADLLGRLAHTLIVVFGFFAACVVIFPSFKPGDIVAGLGVTSVAIGFAFKDILQNYFAGLLILLRRPFKVGDQVRVKDFEGTVEDINMRSTILKTYDGERIILPNGDVYTSSILVRTAFANRRVRFVVGIGYQDSIEEARQVIQTVLAGIDGIARDPAPLVYATELAPSSVNLTVLYWVPSKQADVSRVSDRVVTGIKLALDEAGIDMPYPHTVVALSGPPAERPAHDAGQGC